MGGGGDGGGQGGGGSKGEGGGGDGGGRGGGADSLILFKQTPIVLPTEMYLRNSRAVRYFSLETAAETGHPPLTFAKVRRSSRRCIPTPDTEGEKGPIPDGPPPVDVEVT